MGVCDINWTRPNIRVGNIWVRTLASWKYLGTYISQLEKFGYVRICRLYVNPLSNGRERNSVSFIERSINK